MGKMIHTGGSSKKTPKRKPGWEKAAAEEAAWLTKINSMTLGSRSYGGKAKKPAKSLVVNTDSPTITRTDRNSRFNISSKGVYSREDISPSISAEVFYRDRPDLLARELEARSRKFATAPAYNKGGDVLVTDEMMRDITAGLTRRR